MRIAFDDTTRTFESEAASCYMMAKAIENTVAQGKDLSEELPCWAGLRFLIEKDDDGFPKVVGGCIGPDEVGFEVSERGVFRRFGNNFVGCAFDKVTSSAMRAFFDDIYWSWDLRTQPRFPRKTPRVSRNSVDKVEKPAKNE